MSQDPASTRCVSVDKSAKNKTSVRAHRERAKAASDAKWAKMEQEADEDIKNGRTYGPFLTHEDLIEFLENGKL